MIEGPILRTLLKVLHLVGSTGLRLEVLLDEVYITCAARPSGELIREHLRHAEDEKLVTFKRGLANELRYYITALGEQAYREANQ